MPLWLPLATSGSDQVAPVAAGAARSRACRPSGGVTSQQDCHVHVHVPDRSTVLPRRRPLCRPEVTPSRHWQHSGQAPRPGRGRRRRGCPKRPAPRASLSLSSGRGGPRPSESEALINHVQVMHHDSMMIPVPLQWHDSDHDASDDSPCPPGHARG